MACSRRNTAERRLSLWLTACNGGARCPLKECRCVGAREVHRLLLPPWMHEHLRRRGSRAGSGRERRGERGCSRKCLMLLSLVMFSFLFICFWGSRVPPQIRLFISRLVGPASSLPVGFRLFSPTFSRPKFVRYPCSFPTFLFSFFFYYFFFSYFVTRRGVDCSVSG